MSISRRFVEGDVCFPADGRNAPSRRKPASAQLLFQCATV